MSDTTAESAPKNQQRGDLQSVVRTMKALAASSIGQYEESVRALKDYYRAVELGLGACFRESEPKLALAEPKAQTHAGTISAVVFGSDQGLVGQFNEVVSDCASRSLRRCPAKPNLGGRRARPCPPGGCRPAVSRDSLSCRIPSRPLPHS